MPATAAQESWKPMSNSHDGLTTSITKTASVRLWSGRGGREKNSSRRTMENIRAALTKEVGKPVRKAKAQMSPSPSSPTPTCHGSERRRDHAPRVYSNRA